MYALHAKRPVVALTHGLAMLPMFAGADRLFLAENNGFLTGIVGVFLGFTLLGLPFLMVTPILSGLVVMVPD